MLLIIECRNFVFVNGKQSLFTHPYMSKFIKIDADYSRWIQELKERYRNSQIKAAT